MISIFTTLKFPCLAIIFNISGLNLFISVILSHLGWFLLNLVPSKLGVTLRGWASVRYKPLSNPAWPLGVTQGKAGGIKGVSKGNGWGMGSFFALFHPNPLYNPWVSPNPSTPWAQASIRSQRLVPRLLDLIPAFSPQNISVSSYLVSGVNPQTPMSLREVPSGGLAGALFVNIRTIMSSFPSIFSSKDSFFVFLVQYWAHSEVVTPPEGPYRPDGP